MDKKQSSKETAKKQDSKNLGLIIGCVVGALLVIGVIVFVVVRMVSGKAETLSCSQKTPAVESTAVYDFEGNKVSKAELKYVLDKTVKEDDDTAAGLAILVASKDALEKAYESEPGIDFAVEDSDSKSTITFKVDLKEISSEVREAVLNDDNSETLDEVKKQLEDGGYTCEVK